MKRKIIPTFIILIMLTLIALCYYMTLPMQSKSEEVAFTIDYETKPKTIIKNLKDEELIKNEKFAYIYVKINKLTSLKAGKFILDKNMSLREIFETLCDSGNIKEETMTITFPEGKNMLGIISIIKNNTSITESDITNKLEDKEYLKSLVSKYWFLSDEILNKNIYYALEGYLAPDTYVFKKDASVEDIFEKMLDEEKYILDSYKAKLDKNSFSVHKIITLASIAELEGKTLEDRKNIVGVFYNRLNNGMSLGSDVTTYYGSKVDMSERDLYQTEIDDPNPYNTRAVSSAGNLPIGPICNPSKESIDSVINYTKNDYFYFVSDKNGNIYFTKTDAEHNKLINKLINSGDWFTY